MSKIIDAENVAKLRTALQDYVRAGIRLTSATKNLGECQRAVDSARGERMTLEIEIKKMMDEMDVSSTQNAGYEHRRFVLLQTIAELQN